MWIIEKIFLSVIKNYYPCVHYFPCRKFHVHTAAKPLYKSQQPEPDMATNIQCSEVYELYNDHPFDKPITTRHAKNGGKQMSTMDFLRKVGYKTCVPSFTKSMKTKLTQHFYHLCLKL